MQLTMPHRVGVRRLPPEDTGLILDLDRLLFIDDPPDVGPGTAWWVFEDEHGESAYAGAKLWEPDNAVYLIRAGVLPRARGQGLQRRLVRIREAWGRRNGCSLAYTYTAHHNVASMNSLIRCGYQLWSPSTWAGSDTPMRVSDGAGWLYWYRNL